MLTPQQIDDCADHMYSLQLHHMHELELTVTLIDADDTYTLGFISTPTDIYFSRLRKVSGSELEMHLITYDPHSEHKLILMDGTRLNTSVSLFDTCKAGRKHLLQKLNYFNSTYNLSLIQPPNHLVPPTRIHLP